MGFHIPDSPLKAVGYTAAFSAEQVVRNFGSEYDPVIIEENPAEVEIYHHSEAVYEVTITVRKLED